MVVSVCTLNNGKIYNNILGESFKILKCLCFFFFLKYLLSEPFKIVIKYLLLIF
jgi:hypothetical protein